MYLNPFAIANFINHPGKNVHPNCMFFGWDFFTDFPDEFLPYIPNKYYMKPAWYSNPDPNLILPTVIVIATRNIVDEELFVNYRYNPSNVNPNWYYQPYPEEVIRRWSNVRPALSYFSFT